MNAMAPKQLARQFPRHRRRNRKTQLLDGTVTGRRVSRGSRPTGKASMPVLAPFCFFFFLVSSRELAQRVMDWEECKL